MTRRSLAATALALVAGLAFTGPVAAAAPSATPPANSPELLRVVAIVAAQGPVESVAPKAMAAKARSQGASAIQAATIAASSGCWHGSYYVQPVNYLGWVLFRYSESHDWCGNGTWINYINVYTWASNLFATVNYYPPDTKSSVYGVGWNVWREHVSGHFSGGITPWGPIYNWYPWMEFYVGGGGQTYYERYGM